MMIQTSETAKCKKRQEDAGQQERPSSFSLSQEEERCYFGGGWCKAFVASCGEGEGEGDGTHSLTSCHFILV